MEILTIKQQENGYLVNDTTSVPNDEGNTDYKEVLEAIAGGSEKYPTAIVVEPEFTASELEEQAIQTQISDAQAYLNSTDFKMTTDYDRDTTAVKALRTEARNIIRTLSV